KSLTNSFVSADDLTEFVNNDQLKNFLTTLQTFNLPSIIYSAFYTIFGANPLALHFYAVVLHFINCVLVLILVYMLFGKKASIITALLFGLHPVVTEPIYWIMANKYLLFAVFQFSSLIFYLLYCESQKKRYLAISLALFASILVFSQNPWPLVLPFVIFVLNFIVDKNVSVVQAAKRTLPFVTIALFTFLLIFTGAAKKRVSELSLTYGMNVEQSTPLLNRLPYTIYTAVELWVFPVNLTLFHEGQIIPASMYLVMILVTLVVFGLIVFLWKKQRVVAGLMAIMALTLLPTFSPVQIAFFIAERYMYFGTAFYCTLLAWLILRFEKRIKYFVPVAVVLICILYGIKSFSRSFDWQSSKTLWLSTSKHTPQSARVFNNLGDAYGNEKDFDKSVKAFTRAIEIDPYYADAMHNLGNTYFEMGLYKEAKLQFEKALQINPNYAGAKKAKQILQVLQEKNL
ncbi:hypothetical protein A2W32_01790, partial [candidate division WWE3 bacterium RBG_16_37_10]